MSRNKTTVVAASLVAVAALAIGGATLANASSPTAASAGSSSGSAASGSSGADANQGQAPNGQQGHLPGGHSHTPVTGEELSKVTAAVTAQDSTVTVESVQKDEDGSYDVHGTKDGQRVMLEVSADLATITERTGGGMGRGGGMGGSQDTPVTGAEATKVGDAVQAKDSAVTVESVRKDPDGSYDVLGTKDGQPVFFDVSADLSTVTPNAGGPGRMGGHGGPEGGRAPSGSDANGSAGNGSASNGSAANGSAGNGSAANGSAANGSA